MFVKSLNSEKANEIRVTTSYTNTTTPQVIRPLESVIPMAGVARHEVIQTSAAETAMLAISAPAAAATSVPQPPVATYARYLTVGEIGRGTNPQISVD